MKRRAIVPDAELSVWLPIHRVSDYIVHQITQRPQTRADRIKGPFCEVKKCDVGHSGCQQPVHQSRCARANINDTLHREITMADDQIETRLGLGLEPGNILL